MSGQLFRSAVFQSAECEVFRVSLRYDLDAETPRTAWDNVCTFYTWHSRYASPDKNPFTTPAEFFAWAEEQRGLHVAIVYMLDHGSVHYSLSDFGNMWDSGAVGVIFVSDATIAAHGLTVPMTDAGIRNLFTAEIRVYNDWANGNTCGWEVERGEDTFDKDGLLVDTAWEFVDSCWGYYGDAGELMAWSDAMDCIPEGLECVEHYEQ